MNKKNELLSIGELSKITGANIKSLRYYEEIGVLIPAYVNPDSGYRYYSLAQVHMVTIIQICIELNIPLKDLNKFNDQTQSIDYISLLEHGEDLVERKIKSLQENLDIIRYAKEDVVRIKKYKNSTEPYIRELPEKYFYVLPYNPEQGKKGLYTETTNLFLSSTTEDIEPFYEWGILYEYSLDKVKQYVFMEILPTTSKNENIKVIPGGNYTCAFLENSQAEKIPTLFPEVFEERGYVLAIETEIFANTQQGNKPLNELRVWLG